MAESGDNVAVNVSDNYVEKGVETVAEPVKTEPEPETKHEPAKEPEADAENTENKDGSEANKRGSGYKRKLDKAKAEIERLKALVDAKPALSEVAPERPKPESYQSNDEYVEALTDWKAEQKAREVVRKELSERDAKAQAEKVNSTWNSKVDEAKKVYDDYEDVVAEYDDVPVRKDITDAMLESDVGADIAYYLAKHPEELVAINKDSVSSFRIAKEIGRIEAVIMGKKNGNTAVRTTKAPPPIEPIKTTAKTGNSDPRGYVEL